MFSRSIITMQALYVSHILECNKKSLFVFVFLFCFFGECVCACLRFVHFSKTLTLTHCCVCQFEVM